jgi:hypothetical protein
MAALRRENGEIVIFAGLGWMSGDIIDAFRSAAPNRDPNQHWSFPP